MGIKNVWSRVCQYQVWWLLWLLCLSILSVVRWWLGAVVESEGHVIESFEIILIFLIILAAGRAAWSTPYPKSLAWVFVAWLFFTVILRELSNNDWQLPVSMLEIASQRQWRHGVTFVGSVLVLLMLAYHWRALWLCRQRFFASDLPMFMGLSVVSALILARFFEMNILGIAAYVFFEEFFELTGYFCALLGVWVHRRLFCT